MKQQSQQIYVMFERADGKRFTRTIFDIDRARRVVQQYLDKGIKAWLVRIQVTEVGGVKTWKWRKMK